MWLLVWLTYSQNQTKFLAAYNSQWCFTFAQINCFGNPNHIWSISNLFNQYLVTNISIYISIQNKCLMSKMVRGNVFVFLKSLKIKNLYIQRKDLYLQKYLNKSSILGVRIYLNEGSCKLFACPAAQWSIEPWWPNTLVQCESQRPFDPQRIVWGSNGQLAPTVSGPAAALPAGSHTDTAENLEGLMASPDAS